MTSAAEQLESWWKRFLDRGDQDSRNHLLEHYLPFIKRTAEALHKKMPPEVDLGDMISAGIFGLTSALSDYDPGRGVKFKTYSAARIRGAMLDELRTMDWVARLARARAGKLDSARQALASELGRQPERRELARKLRLTLRNFDAFERSARAVQLISLNTKCFETEMGKEIYEIDVLADQRSEDPYRAAAQRDLRELITRGLSRAERLIIMLYYFEEMTMNEISKVLDLSESRVSQMLSAILGRLRHRLEQRETELTDDSEPP